MKYKYLITLFILGFIGRLLGAMFKITHQAYASEWLWGSTFVMIIALVLVIIKLVKNKNAQSFLNK